MTTEQRVERLKKQLDHYDKGMKDQLSDMDKGFVGRLNLISADFWDFNQDVKSLLALVAKQASLIEKADGLIYSGKIDVWESNKRASGLFGGKE